MKKLFKESVDVVFDLLPYVFCIVLLVTGLVCVGIGLNK